MKYLIIITTLLFFVKGWGQDITTDINLKNNLPEDKIYATPEVMAFQKSHFLPADLYTGKVNVNIPIYEIKSGSISVPVSLSYNTGGIKVDDEATDVGMGWVLNAGGNILRIVKDLEDHTLNYDLGYRSDPSWSITNGAIVSYIDWDPYYVKTDGHYVTKKGFLKTYQDFSKEVSYKASNYSGHAKEDALPDLFLINAPGLSSKFIFKKENNEYKANVIFGPGINIKTSGYKAGSTKAIDDFLGFDALKIYPDECKSYYKNFQSNMNNYMKELAREEFKDYETFEISNINGLVYNFKDYDIVETASNYNGNCDPFRGPLGSYSPGWYLKYLYSIKKSSWHLNQISDPLTNKSVRFTYGVNINPNVKESEAYVYKSWVDTKNIEMERGQYTDFIHMTEYDDLSYNGNFKSWYEYLGTIWNKTTQEQKIKQINWEGGSINFDYNLIRKDRIGNALTDIIVRDNNKNTVKHFKLNYSYFTSKENCLEFECKRLKLTSIDLISSDNTLIDKQYTFNYDESSPLPKVRSLEQDYLGFYNRNGAKIENIKVSISNDVFEDQIPSKFSMHFYPNRGIYSLLPFKLNNIQANYTTINGKVFLEANTYSLLGLLKKITYPTGGDVEFEYENNKFNLFGNEIIAGGARIKKQKIKDDRGNYRVLSYEYKNTDGTSTGHINNIPKYGNIRAWNSIEAKCDVWYDPIEGMLEECQPEKKSLGFYTYNRGRVEVELTNGSFVGYSKVVEREEGNGYKEYYYTSPREFTNEREEVLSPTANFFAKHGQYPGTAYVDNDIRRGKILKELVYNEKHNLLQEKQYNYTYKLFDEKVFKFRESLIYNPTSFHFTEPCYSSINEYFKIKLRTERNLLTEVKTREYLKNDITENKTEFKYDGLFPLLKSKIQENSNGEVLRNEYDYPLHLQSQAYFKKTADMLLGVNNINEVLRTRLYKEDQLISENYILYNDPNSKELSHQPKLLYTKKGESTLEKQISYDKYDDKGNLLQYTPENGIPVSIIWGYNQQYPIAKIEGAFYSEIENEAKNLQSLSNTGDEVQMITALTAMKDKLSKFTVTSYVYKPLVGVSIIIQPNGNKEFYVYDDAGRLKEVKDQDGKLLKTMEYHYK